MTLLISTSEAERLIQDKAGQDLRFCVKSERVINVIGQVAAKTMFGTLSKSIDIDFDIIDVFKNQLLIRYDANGLALSIILKTLLKSGKLNFVTVDKSNSSLLIVDLNKIPQLSMALQTISLNSIKFYNNSIAITFTVV